MYKTPFANPVTYVINYICKYACMYIPIPVAVVAIYNIVPAITQ